MHAGLTDFSYPCRKITGAYKQSAYMCTIHQVCCSSVEKKEQYIIFAPLETFGVITALRLNLVVFGS